jgi:hypothetical protein
VNPLQVRLIRKLTNRLDGVDVSRSRVGDVLDLPDADATALMAEGWAERAIETLVPEGVCPTPKSWLGKLFRAHLHTS